MGERDYTAILEDALDALKKIPEDEHSEAVGETLEAVREDISDVWVFMRSLSAGEYHAD